MNTKIKFPLARQGGTGAKPVVLCIVSVLFFAAVSFGCKENKNEQKMDEETLLINLESAPDVIIPREDLPGWLQERIDFFETGGGTGIPQQLKVLRGLWNGRVVYFLQFLSNCFSCDVFFESGERIVWTDYGGNSDRFFSESKDWTLVYQVVPDYEVIGKSLSEITRLSVDDKYEFPDISHLNDWISEDIMPRRFQALQIPDNVLSNISTAGLLETCLEFPYLLRNEK